MNKKLGKVLTEHAEHTLAHKKVKAGVKLILLGLGRNLNNADLKGTPDRVARLLVSEVLVRPTKKLFQAFPSKFTSMVTLINHRAFTRCPHHFERVEMDVNIAYIPDGRLLGLSKLGRIADYYSSGLMLQEEIAEGIANGLMDVLRPKGVAVYIEAKHMCMASRGLKSTHAKVATSCIKGIFKEDASAKEEFFFQISRQGGLSK